MVETETNQIESKTETKQKAGCRMQLSGRARDSNVYSAPSTEKRSFSQRCKN